MVPKHHPIAQGMRKAYEELTYYYGDHMTLPLYREGQLYNFYLKQSGPPQELNQQLSGFHRQA